MRRLYSSPITHGRPIIYYLPRVKITEETTRGVRSSNAPFIYIYILYVHACVRIRILARANTTGALCSLKLLQTSVRRNDDVYEANN